MPEFRKSTPSSEAVDLLKRLNINRVPVPVERVAKAQGALVRYEPLDEELSGLIYIKQDVPIIGVNALHHPNRQRFTIAHEIGHLILHRKYISNNIHVDKEFKIDLGLRRDTQSTLGIDSIEIEANEFAASLLMPGFLLEQFMGDQRFDIDNEGPIEDLAKKLRVSRHALQFRIRHLV